MTPGEIAAFAERFLRGDFTPEEADALSISDLVALNDYLDKQKWSLYEIRQLRRKYGPLIA